MFTRSNAMKTAHMFAKNAQFAIIKSNNKTDENKYSNLLSVALKYVYSVIKANEKKKKTTFQKVKQFLKKPEKMVSVYISGNFYLNATLSDAKQLQKLIDNVCLGEIV